MENGLQRFANLFQGFTGAYGRTDLSGEKDARGKSKARSWTERKPVTLDLWSKHLDGIESLGIVPLMDDGQSLQWAVIDIDLYNQPSLIFDIQTRIAALKLPLVVCRSKSGGAHCFLFLKEPMLAEDVHSNMKTWAAAIGYPGVEVFPKQITRDDNDVGNWLNMPYFHVRGPTERYAVKSGVSLSLGEFIELAEATAVSPEDFKRINAEDNGAEAVFYEGPPCLKAYYKAGGFPEGTRNENMLKTGVYLKKRYGDLWKEHFDFYNRLLCKPPLNANELKTLEKSLEKKNYDYPKCEGCTKSGCGGQKYGRGTTENELGYDWTALEKHEGDPVIWYATINEKRLQFLTEELMNQKLFVIKILNGLTILPKTLTPLKWAKNLQDKLDSVVVKEAPDSASAEGQFLVYLKRYCNGNAQAESKDEIVNGNPWFDNAGYVLFKPEGLYRYLQNQGFKFPSTHHVWQWCNAAGGQSFYDAELGEYWKVPMTKTKDPEEKPQKTFENQDF